MKAIFLSVFLLAATFVSLAQNCTLTATVTASSNTICTGSTVTLNAAVSGGTAPYTYSWNTGETTATITPSTPGTYTVNITDNTGACTTSASTTITKPNFLKAGDIFICGNTQGTLTASGGDNYQWYDSPGGNLLSSQATYTTPILTSTTTYYVVGTKSGCSTDPTPVVVNVVPVPDAPTAPSVSICAGSVTTLSASSPIGTVFDWYATPTGGQSLITSPDFTTPALPATTTYYVQTYNGSCPGPRTAVTVTVNPVPQKPQATGVSICYNSAAILTATAPTGTIKWYDSSFGNTPVATGPVFQTDPAKPLTTSTTFYVQAVNDDTGCSSSRVPVIVTVMPEVPHPTAPGTIVCSGNAAVLTASSTQNGTTFQWNDKAGNIVSSQANYTTPALSDSTTYYVQGTYLGCTGPKTPVTVNIASTTPTAPIVTGNTTICQGTSATLTTDGAASSYQWYDAASGGNLLPSSGTTFTTPAINTATTYYVQAANGQCISSRTAVNINVNPAPAAPTTGPAPAPICPGGTATLTATGSNITWFDAAGNAVATGNSFTTPALTATSTYYIQSSNGQCSSARSSVTVTVTTVPNPAFTYNSGSFCTTAGPQTPTYYVAGPYHFTVSPAVGLTINPTTGRIIPLNPGTYIVTLTTTSNSCVIATQTVTITPPGGTSQFSYPPSTFCQYDPNPTPTFTSGYAGRFTVTPAQGLVFVDNTTGQIDLTNSIPGTYTITNTLTCGGTPATTTIVIKARTTVNAGTDQNVVTGTPVQLAGSKNGAAGVLWTTNGNGTFSNPATLNPVYTPGTADPNPVTLTLTAAQESSDCPPLSDQMVITFSQPIINASGATICAGTTATLTASGSPNGNYQWYDAASGGNLLSTNATFTTPVLSATTTYYVGTASGARTPVVVKVNSNPVPTVSGATTCFDQQALLTANLPGTSTDSFFQWFDANGTLLATGAKYTTTYLQQSTPYFVRYADPAAGCPSVLTPVNVIVNPLPNINSALTASTCSGVPFSYKITTASSSSNTPISFTWSRAADNENPASSGNTADINETLVNTTTNPFNVVYNISATSANCSSAPFRLVVTVNPALIFTSGGSKEICNAQSPDYQVQLNFTPSSISWSRATMPGIRNPGVSGQTFPVIREILYNNSTNSVPITVTYLYTAKSGDCTVTVFPVKVTVDPPVTVTSPAAATVCSGTQFTYNITSKVNGASFNWKRASISGISNQAADVTSSSTISETLINTTGKAIVVTYQITPFYNTCPGAVFNYRVTVNPTPATPVINAADRICTGTTLDITTPAVAGATYAWTGPANFTSNQQNPSIPNITQANAGDYTLTVLINGCSSSTTTKTIAVDVQPVATAGPNQTVCAGYPIQLKGTVTGGLTTGVWTSTGTGNFTPSNTDLNAKYIPSAADAALSNLDFTLSSSALDNCAISVSKLTVTLPPPPKVNAGGDKNICNQDTSVPLNGTATNADSYLWTTTGSGTFSPAANVLNPTYIMSADDLKNGSVKFLLSGTNAYCMAYDEKLVKFLPPPVISAGPKKPTYVLRNSLIRLSPTVDESNVHYKWSPNTYLDNDTLKNATYKAAEDQTFTLVVTDTLGCVTSDQVSFIVLDPIVTYNTFTPNGDGRNDTWVIPAINKYPGAKVDIYNRYGVQLFHSDGYGIPWDGTYQGQPVPTGVYYYVITTKFDPKIFSGYVTVLR